MKLKNGFFALLSRLSHDQSGSILVQFTVCIIAVFGFIGLALDGGRWYLLHSSLQDLGDAAALAGAADLDGTTGAIARATADAQAMVATSATQSTSTGKNYPRWYDVLGSTTITVNFYSALDPDTVTTVDKDAKYIQVITDNTWTVAPTFLVAVGALSKTAGATAWAQSTSAQCFPSAMMLCNPSEPSTGSTGNSFSTFNPNPGQEFIFSTTGNSSFSPGVFNLIQTPTGSNPNSDAAIEDFLSQQFPGQCFAGGTSPSQGQKTSATKIGINVRFDQYPNGQGQLAGLDQTPSPIVIDGINTNPQGNNCQTTTATPPGFQQTDFDNGTTYDTTCNSSPPTGSCPLPNDRSFTSVGGSGGSQIGSGPQTADLQAYWQNHHGTSTLPIIPANTAPRYYLYQQEVSGTGTAGTWNTDAFENHTPQCAPTSTEVAPEYTATRRILHVAVIDCNYWQVQGNTVNNIPTNTYADFFLINSTPTSGTNVGQIYTEFVAKYQINGTSSALHRIVQLVR